MPKKAAIVVVNPVNGLGLFQYLEPFYESGIVYKTYAVGQVRDVKSNSGILLQTDDIIGNLRGEEAEYDALVFACGDAMPKFGLSMQLSENQDLITVVKNFGLKRKLMVGHCVAALVFDIAAVAEGKRVACHPLVKTAIKTAIATDEKAVIDGNLYTAQNENYISAIMPTLLESLKE
ncbi:MAG: DJ-1/PfpI family protein [Bacteroidales bacterium]|jgi:putative intracellular protease/amidase|nr:DJ-1/PfpI family protein [Bacteroidales bacterium]